MILRALSTLALALPATLIAQDAAAPGKRALVFQRPETKDAKYELTSKASFNQTTDFHIEGEVRPGGRKSMEVTLEGTFAVTAVSPTAGNVTGYTFTINKMTLTDGSGADDGLEPGTVITAKVEKAGTTFYAHGGEVKGTLKDGLAEALPQFSGLDEPHDELFHPPGPVAPGDKWEPDKTKYAETLQKIRHAELDSEKSKVRLTYSGPAKADGMEADTVLISHSVTYTKFPGLPDDAVLKSATETSDVTIAIAKDAKISAPLSERANSDFDFSFTTNRDGNEYEVVYKTHSDVRRTMKPVK